MTNKLTKRRYNKLLSGRNNYFAFGDFMFKKNADGNATNRSLGNLSELGSGIMSAAGLAVGLLGGGAIGGGLQSGIGNTFSSLGSIAGAALPGPIGALASAGLGLVGGITNRMFGSKLNTENVAKVEANINNLNNFQSNASDFDTLSLNWADAVTGMTFNDSYIGKNGWFNKGASNKAASLRDQIAIGNAWVLSALNNNALNIQNTLMLNLLANYAAYGGPLFADGGSIYIKPENRGKFTETKRRTGKTTEELTHSKNPLTRKRAIFALNAKKWHHAFGGDLMTHGANFDTGITLVGNGNTHEENPYEGVPMGVDPEGTPNLVEEGEVIFNDYVFSNRLKVPKAVRRKYKLRGNKPLTFADAALQMSKESEERPNDPISKNGLEALLEELAYALEDIKSKELESLAKKDFNNLSPEELVGLMQVLNSNLAALGGLLNKFDNGGRKFGQYILNPYGWVRGYNAGNWMVNGNYTDDYRRRVNAMTTADWQLHLKDLLDYYSNPSNRGTDRYRAIDYMYRANPWIKDYTVTDNDVATMAELAKSNPGFMHPMLVLQRQLDAEAQLSNLRTAPTELFKIRQGAGNAPIDFPEGETPWLGRVNGYRYGEDPDNPVNYKYIASETKNGVTTHYYDPVELKVPGKAFFRDSADTPWSEGETQEEANRRGVNWEEYGTPHEDEKGNKYYTKLKAWKEMPEFDDQLRYAPIVGSLMGLGMGLFSKPDESGAEAVLEASRGAGAYQPVRFNPVGNYLTYRPFDTEFAINQANAESAAARRALMNTSGGNRAVAMAGILAADNNALNQLGVLRRGATEGNLKQMLLVEGFNRATNMSNSEGFFKANAANQAALALAREPSFRGVAQAEELRLRARLAHDNAIQTNLTNLFTSIGNIGQERVARLQMKWIADNGLIPGYTGTKSAKGGKIKRKKKGLTY